MKSIILVLQSTLPCIINRYCMKKMKDGKLGVEKSKQLEDVLELRDLTIHTGGRRKKTIDAYNGLQFMELCP